MSDVLLQMRGISKSFQGVKALEQVELTLRSGEIHALMGENGAGKSTLIKVLTGVHGADEGSIIFAQQAIAPRSTRAAETHGISTVFQEVNLIPSLSIADNIVLGRQPTRWGLLRPRAIRQRARTALARLGLDLDPGTRVGACSMAVQQMVAIARALDIKARLLILDEPTSSLDEREVGFLFGIMRQLRNEGLAILFVTHFLDQVYAVTDRITVLRNGTFVGEYETAQLPRLALLGAMLGREFEELERRGKDRADEGVASEKQLLTARGIGKRGWMQPVDLDIARGEVVGLAGLLGSGRTETAKMLFGIQVPETGQITFEHKRARLHSPRDAIRLGLAFCSEDRKSEGIVPHLSVRENLILALQASRGPLRLLGRAEQETLARHYIGALNIKTTSMETPVQHLSGGNQQKVLLARWLALQPKLIILDEPTRGIDVGAKAEIEKLVHNLAADGMSVLFISSDLEEIVRTCARVVVLRDRKRIGALAGEELQVNTVMNLIAQHEN